MIFSTMMFKKSNKMPLRFESLTKDLYFRDASYLKCILVYKCCPNLFSDVFIFNEASVDIMILIKHIFCI